MERLPRASSGLNSTSFYSPKFFEEIPDDREEEFQKPSTGNRAWDYTIEGVALYAKGHREVSSFGKRKEMKTPGLPLAIVILAVLLVPAPMVAFAQTEKLGDIEYKPPRGWTKTVKENVAIFTEINQSSGIFCVITLYGVTPSIGTPQNDFAKEWSERVVKPWSGEANPKTNSLKAEGWTLTAGGSPVDFQGYKAVAVLNVLSGFGKTISILGIYNDDSYLATLQTFIEGMEVDKTAARVEPPAAVEPQPAPQPARAVPSMHAAALVREFEGNEVRANATYVGKRVRITGTVNSIEINQAGQIVLTFKSSVSTYKNARCYFNKSQSERVSALSAHQEATVEGTVKGLGGGFDNTKAYLVLESCTIP
jgi:hypothetical protein